MALVGMCMSMPFHTGDISQPCEKQFSGDPANIEWCKYMRLTEVCARNPSKAWCCVKNERNKQRKKDLIAYKV